MTTIGEANAINQVLRYILGGHVGSDAAEGSAGYLAQRAREALKVGLSRDEVSERWPRLSSLLGASGVLAEVRAERARQDERWGEQNHPDGTGGPDERLSVQAVRGACQAAAERGEVTWLHILDEEVAEAFAESDLAKLRAELVQVAAVCVAWIESIDRREVAQ